MSHLSIDLHQSGIVALRACLLSRLHSIEFSTQQHQCPCCKRPSKKRSIVSAAQGLEAMCKAYKHVVRDAAFTAMEYDESCLAMTQIAPTDSSDESRIIIAQRTRGEIAHSSRTNVARAIAQEWRQCQ